MSLAVAMPTAAELVSRALEKYNPLQPRDREGQWTDGMPDDLVSIPVKVMGGTVTASSRRGGDGKATLTANGRSVDLDSRDLEELRKTVISAQYGDDSQAGSDGVYRVVDHGNSIEGTKSKILVSLRPVEGKLISETGKKFSNPDDAPDDEEYYSAEFDMVVGEGEEGEFDDYPSTRVSLKDLESDDNLKSFASALHRATAARRIDTGNGPTDVFSPRAGVVGFRMKDDNGNPTEVLFNAGEARRLKSAMEDVLYGEDEGVEDLSIPRDEQMTFDTSDGVFVEARFKGHRTDRQWVGTLTLFPDNAPWSVAVDGPAIDDFLDAFNQSGAMAGIRAFESDESALGVHSMPLSRALEAFSVMSPSPAVRLMMLARALEADDTFSRRGHLITVNRGGKGRFARKVGSAVDAAAAVRAIVDTPKKPRAPRNAVAKALASGDSSALDGLSRESLRREAKARGLDVPRGVSEDVLKDMLWDDENSSKSDGAASAMADGFGGRDSETADAKRERADSLLSDMPDDQAGRDRVHTEVGGLILDADRMDAAAKPARSRAKAADTDAVADRIRALPHKPESRAALAAELDQLGAADMRAVADKWNIPLPKRTTKAQSRQAIETRLEQLIDHDSVLNGGWDGGRQPAAQAAPDKPLSFFGQMKQAHADAMAADMAARAARKAAAAAEPKRSRRAKAMSAQELQAKADAISGTDNIWAKLRKAHEEEGTAPKMAGTAEPVAPRQPRAKASARRPKPVDQPSRAEQMAAISGDPDIWGKLRAAHAEDEANRASAGSSPVSSAVDALRPMVDNPQPDARERTDEVLGRLTSKQMDEVAKTFGATIGPTSNVAQKRQRLREILVGGKLDSAAIARGTSSWRDEIGGGPGPINSAAMRAQLVAAPDADGVRAILRGQDLTDAQARALAKDLGVKSAGRSKRDEAIEKIVNYFHPKTS